MKFLIKVIIVTILLSSGESYANARSPFSSITIVVSSYDKFSNIWNPFFNLLFKSWPSLKTYNKDVKIVLVGNEKVFPDPRVFTSLSPLKKGWSGNINDALQQVDTEFVLYLQDDYFLRGSVNEGLLRDVLAAMHRNKLDYVELYPRCVFPNGQVKDADFLTWKDPHKPCQTTLQAAIWRNDSLKALTAEKVNSIWAFEDIKVPQYKMAYYNKMPTPISYLNFMYRGHINFRPFMWLYYQGYDLNFLEKNTIHPQYKFLGKEVEWYRRNMPTISGVVFYIGGWFKHITFVVKTKYYELFNTKFKNS